MKESIVNRELHVTYINIEQPWTRSITGVLDTRSISIGNDASKSPPINGTLVILKSRRRASFGSE